MPFSPDSTDLDLELLWIKKIKEKIPSKNHALILINWSFILLKLDVSTHEFIFFLNNIMSLGPVKLIEMYANWSEYLS
jgi:hypothetical protein